MSAAIDDDEDGATFGDTRQLCSDGTIPARFSPQSATPDCDETNPLVQTNCGTCTTRLMGTRTVVGCSDRISFNNATTQCTNRGMFLVSIHSAAEVDFIEETISFLGFNVGGSFPYTWMGRRENSPVRWVDGSALDFAHYVEGGNADPAAVGGSGGETCVCVSSDARTWDDEDCSFVNHAYVCATPP